jgi:hypothetical protein
MKEMLTIPMLNGDTYDVEVEIVGDLALHHGRLQNKDKWYVTHVPTLLSMEEAIPKNIKRGRTVMLKWMGKVQKGIADDWITARRYSAGNIQNYPEESKDVRDRIKAHCLKTTV